MSEEKVTYCRICEPLCGLVATVEDGKVTKLRPDADHPLSKGFACPKGIAMTEVQNDPDRVLHPLRRKPGGGFEQVSWDEALDDIGARLKAIVERDGGDSVAWYLGNPGAFSYSHPLWVKGFLDGIGSPHLYSASSQDVSNRFAASALLYGSPYLVPIPDLTRTKLLFMLGANPLVSHGSVMSAPRIGDQLRAIVKRGGRVIVVDPRRSETARAFEHVAVNPDSDAWLLMSILQVIFDEGLDDAEAIEASSRGVVALQALVAPHAPEQTEPRTGVSADQVRALARDIAAAEGAAIYGRTGSCLGRNGTLVSFLLDAIAVVTGNLDRPGGSVFGTPPIDFERAAYMLGLATYGKHRTRIGNFPDVLAQLPASLMAKEMTTDGKGQIKAFFVSAGNPVLSVPNGGELEEAMEALELSVSIDLYVNDTNRNFDYVLPGTTFLEREDFPLPFLSLYTTPFIQMTERVVEPAGEAREEWEIIEAIARRIGKQAAPVAPLRLLGRFTGIRLSPRRLVELLMRGSPDGDWFGIRRSGLSIGKLKRNPHGIVLADEIETGILNGRVRHKDKRVRLDPPEIAAEIKRMAAANGHDPDFPLRMIGLRELRSHNSWMHNAPKLMAGNRVHAARVNPADAEAAGLTDGDPVRITSARAAVEVPSVIITDEVKPGTIAVPHGWGHKGGWELAKRAGGANINLLASNEPEDLEVLAGMAHLNGIPVRVERVATAPEPGIQATRAVPV